MKKKLFIGLLATILLSGCISSNPENGIGSEEGIEKTGLSVEEIFDVQIDEAQYLVDLEDFLSYNILSITEDRPYTSDFSLTADFDKDSSLQGGVFFSQKNISKAHDLETSDIELNVDAKNFGEDREPFSLSGNVSFLYQDGEMYANLHNFGIFMGNGNMMAKMYTLLGDMVRDKWVDLEANSGGIVSINKDEEIKLPYIVGTLRNVLKSEWVNEDSPNFVNGVAELIEMVNSYINLGISTEGLSLQSVDTLKYSELKKGIIQKEFVGNFQGNESAFDLSLLVSKDLLQVRFYNVKRYDEDIMDYKDTDYEVSFSLKENKKSDYSITFQSQQSRQVVVDIDGDLKYGKQLEFLGKFILEPLELVQGQKISGNIEGKIIKKFSDGAENFPELSGEILSLSSILSSL